MITDQVAAIIKQAVKHKHNIDVEPLITYPEAQFGDYATNVAFQLAKSLKMAPQAIAAELGDAIEDPQVAEVTTVNGFINLRMSVEWWLEQLHQIKPGYGSSDTGKSQRLQVEFISANPTGPLTVGNGRGGYGGDVLANVLGYSGFKVEREYYLNDAGNQVKVLKQSILAKVQERLGVDVLDAADLGEDRYKGEYVDALAQPIAEAIMQQNPDLKELDPPVIRNILRDGVERQNSLKVIISLLKDVTKRMGIEFDDWFSEERELHRSGKVEELVGQLVQAGKAEEREGAIWLIGSSENQNDRVLRKSDGTYTYLAADLAYHRNKLEERGFNTVINLWGADHHSQVPALQNGLKLMGVPGRLDIIIFQLVRLIKDGQEYKVSKRAGTYVTMDELLDEIPTDVLRFFFLMRSFNTPMDLDLDQAKEQSQKNPYYYVMYSYARANSILEQASQAGLSPINTATKLSDVEIALVRQMSRLPQLLQEIARDYGVHRLTFFGMETARLFHDLYEAQRIIDTNKAESSKRLYIVEQYRTFMELYFNLMGITPQRRMEQQPVQAATA